MKTEKPIQLHLHQFFHICEVNLTNILVYEHGEKSPIHFKANLVAFNYPDGMAAMHVLYGKYWYYEVDTFHMDTDAIHVILKENHG